MKPTYQFFTVIVATILLSSCSSSNSPDSTSERFLYTSTNDSSGNAIIQFNINADGSVAQQTATFTGGNGDAAEGDFDGQNSLIVIDNYLLAVNAGTDAMSVAGNGSISVFSINATTGGLTKIDQNIDSGGIRPVSLSSQTIGTKTWVLVANQHSNPHYDGTATTRDAVIDSLGNPSIITNNVTTRNLVAFQFNNDTGELSAPTPVATYSSGNWGGPAQVSFSPNGERVAVTTWGVAQFGNGVPNAAVQRPSRIYFYTVSTNPTLTLTAAGIFEKPGLSGSIGFNWGNNNDRVFVANFNLATTDTFTADGDDSMGNFGATVISATGATGTNTFATILSGSDPQTNQTNEVCWTWLSDNRLYTSSFGSNVLSYFTISDDANSTLIPQISYIRKDPAIGPVLPTGDSKDITIVNNGTLYVSGGFSSHSISIFNPTSDGFYSEQNTSPYRVPFSIIDPVAGRTVANTKHAYLGLVGY